MARSRRSGRGLRLRWSLWTRIEKESDSPCWEFRSYFLLPCLVCILDKYTYMVQNISHIFPLISFLIPQLLCLPSNLIRPNRPHSRCYWGCCTTLSSCSDLWSWSAYRPGWSSSSWRRWRASWISPPSFRRAASDKCPGLNCNYIINWLINWIFNYHN